MSAAGVILTCFGIGRLRPAPGTWGSLPPVIIAFALATAGDAGAVVINTALVLAIIVFGAACLAWGSDTEARLGRKDAQVIVADEVAGQSLALVALPWPAPGEAGSLERAALMALSAFVAFRIFDISKPPPARRLERLRGGAGILIDDLVAGAYALAAVQIIWRALVT